MWLADAIRPHGWETVFTACRGDASERAAIIGDAFGPEWLSRLRRRIDAVPADCILLQYTPVLFFAGNWGANRQLAKLWREMAAEREAVVILHEAHYRSWTWPPSVIRSIGQERAARRITSAAKTVFCSSDKLIDLVRRWHGEHAAEYLPLGSMVPVASADRDARRAACGLRGGEIVLTLFGGGTNLRWMARHVDEVDRILSRSGLRYRWLLLGKVPTEWFRFETPPLAPGYLCLADLSAHLQLSDIFLVPHRSGLSARRTTFMAALEHGLPVVGTEGPMTDDFLREAAGISLFGRRAAADFAERIMTLGRDAELRRRLGRQNADFYCERFSWSLIGRRFAECVGTRLPSATRSGHRRPAHTQPALIRS